MILSVPKEVVEGENRVAIVPETIAKLKKIGYEIQIEKGAGISAGFLDESYVTAGATIVSDTNALYANADVLVKVQRPGKHPSGKAEVDMMKKGALLISFFYPMVNTELVKQAASAGISVIAMDSIPRTTKAQRMDALSSQTNLAGYKAVILGAEALGKIFPLLMTAAGTVQPAKVVIMGAGVAGLQAIATAKRLGAIVEVSDVRAAVKEQVESLGGKYIELPVQESLEGAGGYAKEASAEFLEKQREILTRHIAAADVVITTALVPGKKAPILVTKDMFDRMKPGSVVVDLAAEQGGNCELTQPGKSVVIDTKTVVGYTNIVATVPVHASELYSRNILNLVEYITKENALNLDPSDEIVQGSLIVQSGNIVHQATKQALGTT